MEADMSDQRTRRALEAPVSTPEGFISFPAEFRDAPADLRQVIKIIHRPTVKQGAVGLEFSTDAMVVDFSEVNADRFNIRRPGHGLTISSNGSRASIRRNCVSS